ncbi:outer dense fiber protein 3-like [Meleagris gallopavo]|uniref:outer dense fiber protein 3-like n=1 Tax=Meleagris gallopavo TaxID=9103 RepID=UPI00093D649A|nr:outer dense fiber protein 3-like [Meleagris gallopavo]
MTLLQTPGPAALPKVAVDAYKTRAPAYTMAARPKPAEGKAAKPGPADYSVGRVTLIKPQAPASTFGIWHSLYTTPSDCGIKQPSLERPPLLSWDRRGQEDTNQLPVST